jgi:TfoX/Sxy family transcriptional regulator of competence genes
MMIERVRAALADRDDVVEKRMVGGRSFLVNGQMRCGVVGDELMVRLADADYGVAARQRFVRPMTLGGRPFKRCLIVGAEGTATEAQLKRWLALALAAPAG